MSDIRIDLPLWIIPVICGAIYWPLTLFFGLLCLYVGAMRVRGIGRVAFIVIGLLLVGDAALGIYHAFFAS